MIFTIPCLMGTESLVADELIYGGFSGVSSRNGSVSFEGDIADGARANVFIRCGERVLITLGSFHAATFEELFEGVKALPWEELIGKDDAFPVKGYSVSSVLKSVPACQSIIKKAIVERLKSRYGQGLPETGVKKQVQFGIIKDEAALYIDTSGAPLYKRGYKLSQSEASIRETLAASMIKIARYKGREDLYDPMCGAGTIAIEAAQVSLGIAPGVRRSFACESFGDGWKNAVSQAKERAKSSARAEKLPVFASDTDEKAVSLTRENAERAGILKYIEVFRANAVKTDWSERKGVLMCDPPYGVRMMDQKSARLLIRDLGERTASNTSLKKYIISADDRFEEVFGRRADKRRKLYNGMIKCDLYMYYK